MYHNLRELLQQAEDHEVLLSEIVLQMRWNSLA